MKTAKRRIPPKAQIAVVAAGVLFVAIVGWLVLVSPQRSKASHLKAQIVSTEAQLTQAKALSNASKQVQPIRVADLFRLAKAMPDQADMAGMLLQLNGVARASGITFQSITPGASVPINGYQAVPVTLTFQGDFYGLNDFLLRLRNLVGVRAGRLDARGRLYAVDTLAFAQGDKGFPQIGAKLVVDAFVYGTGVPASSATAATTDTTATTTDTTTPPPADGATAAGAP